MTARRLLRTNPREALLLAGMLVALVKSIQFALDSQALFYFDSGAFILNGLRLAFVSYRSYVYGGLIRVFAVPFHSLRAIVAMQAIMGGLTAWLLAFALVRFFAVRPWIAILAALVFACDPVQMVHEHMVMAETAALLAMAVYLVAALEYFRTRSLYWLPIIAFLGIVLVSLRTVYLPVVLAAAVPIPLAACFPSCIGRPRILALALAVSCGSTALFHVGYRHLTGRLAGREPAYQYASGLFLLADVTPIVEPGDSDEPAVSAAVMAQSKSPIPLVADRRNDQLWHREGLIARLRMAFGGDEPETDQAAQRLARAAIRRDPLGYLGLGVHTWLGFWRGIPDLRRTLEGENGMQPPHQVKEYEASVIFSVFGADVSNRDKLLTLSRRYHIFAADWYVFLLVSPFLTGLAWWLRPPNPKGVALFFFWSCLLLGATCLGGVESAYRFVHPFSFTSLAGTAILCEMLMRHGVAKPRTG